MERKDGRNGALSPPGTGGSAALANWWGGNSGAQLALLVGTVLLFGFFGANTLENMQRFGITPGFGFLDRPAGFEIGESLIAYSPGDSYARAIGVGLLNTVKVAVAGCLLATVLGVGLGIARMSGNLLLSGLVQGYVELVRNTPLLLQLFFWSAMLHALPAPRQALNPVPGVFLSNRGIQLPAFQEPATVIWLGTALLAALLLAAIGLAVSRRRGRSGPGYVILVAVPALTVPGMVLLAAGAPLAVEMPELRGFNFTGGMSLSPEFAALLIGLVVNAAAVIAEIVRSGIQAVPAGQWEAARSLGLPRRQVMRLVVLPQALRVIVPLMTSSYLNLTKNSSLAVAIGFPDLVSVVNTSANQTGQVLETMLLLMAVYLALNLAVSAAMNAYNRRLARRGWT